MFRILLLLCVPLLAPAADVAPTNGDFETAHKLPGRFEQNDFHTAHKIPVELQNSMALLPTKEKPELNPILSALINEDVMKSIEAKRAIEERELAIVKAEAVLTTPSPAEQRPYDDDINVDFVDQMINLDVAGSENNKKSRIEIKKGPNGQEYEYEYVYYYEDEEDGKAAGKKANKAADPPADKETRGKSRYSSIDRSSTTTATENTLQNVKGDETGSERLPAATRFPNRGKSAEAPPTPPQDQLENAAQKKKSSIKRPSLELVDSETFNTDEKQIKGTRNGDTEKDNEKDTVEQNSLVATKEMTADEADNEFIATEKDEENVEQTTPAMEKAALDLYAILANENFNMDMITNPDFDITTTLPDTTNMDEDSEGATTVSDSDNDESSATLITSTTTTTTTPAPTTTTEATTTTTTTEAPAVIGGGRRGLKSPPGRNRFKGRQGGVTTTTSTTTESPEKPSLTGKLSKNRFSRPPIGGRNRAKPSTSTTPEPTPTEEEEVQVKTVGSTNSALSRNRPRNRFNLRGTSTTTEKVSTAEEENAGEEKAASSTARPTRGRPGFGGRGRSRTTAAAKHAETEEHPGEEETAAEGNNESQTPSTAKPRFSLKTNRLNLRGKAARTTSAPPAEAKEGGADEEPKADDTAAKEADEAPAGASRFNKAHQRANHIQKTDTKSKIASAPAPARKVNPLLAKRRLQLGSSTTESSVEQEEPSEKSAPAADSEDATSEDIGVTNAAQTDEAETTTAKQTPRGLGLLGQRRRLPLRKPGTLL